MNSEKISISISPSLAMFIDSYKVTKGCKSRSQVIEEALTLLREKDLENAYREASKEIESEWEIVAGDGLGDETW